MWRGAKGIVDFCRFQRVFRGSQLVLHVTGIGGITAIFCSYAHFTSYLIHTYFAPNNRIQLLLVLQFRFCFLIYACMLQFFLSLLLQFYICVLLVVPLLGFLVSFLQGFFWLRSAPLQHTLLNILLLGYYYVSHIRITWLYQQLQFLSSYI